MINREQLKLEIDTIDDAYLEILHRIILALKQPSLEALLNILGQPLAIKNCKQTTPTISLKNTSTPAHETSERYQHRPRPHLGGTLG